MNNRILVIDDQETILDDFRAILCPDSRAGSRNSSRMIEAARLMGIEIEEEALESYQVTTARQGQEGYELALRALEEEKPFALAFIDIRMPPGWDGMKTASEIRKVDKSIEIVIVTAYSDRDRREIVKAVGAPDKLLYLKKPFDVEEIRQLALCLTQKWELHQREKKHRLRLEGLLRKITTIKTHTGDTRKILSTVLDEVRDEVGAEKGLIVLVKNGEIEVEAQCGPFEKDEVEKIIRSLSREELRGGAPVTMGEYTVMPLKTDVLEAIIVFGNHIKKEDIPILELFLASASELIINSRLFEKGLRNEKMASIGLAVRTLLHDLKNPLMRISATLEFCLIQPELPEKISRWIRAALEGTGRIGEMIKDISDYSLGRIHLRRAPVDLGLFVNETLSLWSDLLKKECIALQIQVGRNISVSLDRTRFRRVLDNLIGNAVEAMEECSRRELVVSAEVNGDHVTVCVRDTGPGIHPEIIPRLFEPFQSMGKRQGCGLGLAVVKDVVELHRGRVSFETGPTGTAFFLEMPVDGESVNG